MTTRYVSAGFALALCLHFLAIADRAKAADVDVTDVIGGACVPDSATVRAGSTRPRDSVFASPAARAGFGCSVHTICTPKPLARGSGLR